MEPAVNSWARPGPKYNIVCFDSNQPNQSLPPLKKKKTCFLTRVFPPISTRAKKKKIFILR